MQDLGRGSRGAYSQNVSGPRLPSRLRSLTCLAMSLSQHESKYKQITLVSGAPSAGGSRAFELRE